METWDTIKSSGYGRGDIARCFACGRWLLRWTLHRHIRDEHPEDYARELQRAQERTPLTRRVL